MSVKIKGERLYWIAGIDLILLFLGFLFATIGIPLTDIPKSVAFLSISVAAIGLITFFGTLTFCFEVTADTAGKIRTAITITCMTIYFVIVGIVTFYPFDHLVSEITKTMLTSFTAIVGVVVGFFFGASAYLRARGKE